MYSSQVKKHKYEQQNAQKKKLKKYNRFMYVFKIKDMYSLCRILWNIGQRVYKSSQYEVHNK